MHFRKCERKHFKSACVIIDQCRYEDIVKIKLNRAKINLNIKKKRGDKNGKKKRC